MVKKIDIEFIKTKGACIGGFLWMKRQRSTDLHFLYKRIRRTKRRDIYDIGEWYLKQRLNEINLKIYQARKSQITLEMMQGKKTILNIFKPFMMYYRDMLDYGYKLLKEQEGGEK